MISTQIRKLELQNIWTISRNSSRTKDNVFVKIEKDGVTGIGEAAPNVRYNETAELTRHKIRNAEQVLSSHDLSDYAKAGLIIDQAITDQNCARAALDIALMDWVAKSKGVPLYKMLELDPRKTPLTSYSIGIDKPDVIRQKVIQAAKYPILKVKVGHETDKDIIEAVRSVTDKPIRVDANEGWRDKELAIELIEWMQSKGVEFIEQPLPARMLEETAWIRERIGIPLVADESVMNAADIPALAGAFDGINIKLMKSGGIQEAIRMIAAARKLDLKIMLGCMIESSVAISAAAHISPLVDWADLDGNLLITNDPYNGVKVRDGRLMLNDLPGIGVTEN